MTASPSIAQPLFDSRRFKSTADYYLRGRLDYPPELIQRVAERVKLDSKSRVLDLGCGPGFLAVAFSPFAGETIGLDPEPDMIAVAEHHALEIGANVTYQRGSSYDLDATFGKFRLVVMGRSFHWMDRAKTLETLDGLIDAEGAVALFRDVYLDVPENSWRAAYTGFLNQLKERDSARKVTRSSRADHTPVLLESPFSKLEKISVTRQVSTTASQLLHRALSFSGTSPERLGTDKDRFLEDLEALLLQASPSGVFQEIVETEALLACRRFQS